MKQIIVKSQEEFDKIKEVKADEEVIFESSKIRVNCILEVFGILRLKGEINCNFSENRYIRSWGSSQVHNESWGSSQVHNVSRGSSQVHNESRESSQVHNESWGSSQVHNESRESSQVIFSQVTTDIKNIVVNMFNFSVLSIPMSLKIKIKKTKNVVVQRYKTEDDYFRREGIEVRNKKVILFKRVSKDFKTQEGTPNETLWQIGSVVTHKDWQPEKEECNGGKFHGVSRPYFGDEFRGVIGDKYIALEVKIKDTYQWKDNPQYPHKIGFREGRVLWECDRYGVKK